MYNCRNNYIFNNIFSNINWFFNFINFYFFKIKDYLRSKIFINSKMLGFILPQERAIDINNKEDLIFAKKLFKFL